MNLIEQLGGYEVAKKKYSERPHAFVWGDIGKALLSYRRQHNIFEMGDLITHPLYGWKILKVHDPIKSENLLFAKTNDHVKHHWDHGLVFDDKYVVAISYSECRHATSEEIKAGHRL